LAINDFVAMKSREIVVHRKNSLFQQKFEKKLYHFNRHEIFQT